MGESPKRKNSGTRPNDEEGRQQRAILKQQCEALERLVSEGEKKMQARGGVAPIFASYRNVPSFVQQRQRLSYTPYVARSYYRPNAAVPRQSTYRPYRHVPPIAISRVMNNPHHRVWKKSTVTQNRVSNTANNSVPPPPPPRVNLPVIVLPTPKQATSNNVISASFSNQANSSTPSVTSRFSGPIRPIVKLNSSTRFHLKEDHLAAKLRKEEKEKKRKAKEESKRHSPSKYKLDRRVPSSLVKSVTLGGLNLAQRRFLLKNKNPHSRLSASFSIQQFSVKRRKKHSISELDLNLSSLSQQQKAPIRLATRFIKQSKKRLLKKTKNQKDCVFFIRTGICRRKEDGKCPFEHDPNKRLLCQRYLKTGTCEITECALSHDKEKGRLPPLCRFFKRGTCSKTAEECPFSHSQQDFKPSKEVLKSKEEEVTQSQEEEPQGRYFEMHPDSQPEKAVIPRRLPKGCVGATEVSVKSEGYIVSKTSSSPKSRKRSSSSSSSSDDHQGEDEEVVFLGEKRKPRPPPAFISFRS